MGLPLEELPSVVWATLSPTERVPMSCKIQASLTEAWSNATSEFSSAIKALTVAHAGMSEAEYRGLRAKAETARLASENARLLLELHRNEHGC
jgi:hypothetical protein